MAEYILYNLIFAKNELMFDDIKTAMLCDLLWKLLEFDPEAETPRKEDGDKRMGIDQPKDSHPTSKGDTIEFRGDGIDIDPEHGAMLTRKIALFKKLILAQLHEANPVLKMNV